VPLKLRPLHPPLLRKMNFPMMMTPFHIKRHFLIRFILHLNRILHNQNINLLEHVCLDREHPIDPA
jgi:hypothetical protein